MTESKTTFIPVVLSGGSGTRLWPASRLSQPKQLLPLVEDRSMLRATVDRVAALGDTADPIIVTNKDHADLITREMNDSGYANARLILEPVGRNTAPAVAVAAMEALNHGDPLMLVLPADHTIADEEAFRRAIEHATGAAVAGYLVTFGIHPSHPETGYGYIRIGEPINSAVHRVVEFKEKPDATTAQTYIDSGDYLWNSGMFLIKASRYLEELELHAPDIARCTREAYTAAEVTENLVLLDPDTFSACRSDSIDYAVMESTSMAAVVPTDPGWNDVGSWSSLYEIASKDAEGNVLVGDVIAIDTSGTYVRSTGRLVATVGLDDVVVVETPDAVLVTRRDATQDVKAVVDRLREAGRQELQDDGTVLRPWGRFRVVESGPGYRILHLWLDPGAKTPLKSHRNQTENWSVVKGIARVTSGDTTKLVRPNESISIPPGETHRLENKGDDILEVIGFDVGSHIGDDVSTQLDADRREEKNG